MPATPADLFAFLTRLGIAHHTVTHPALFTVEQSRALRGLIPGGHTKNLFLKTRRMRCSWSSRSKMRRSSSRACIAS
jgi:Ala-tRNA(Pro) deacylase